MPNQEPAFAWPFGNGPVRVGTQGLFRLCLKTFVEPFLPARLTAPGSPRMPSKKLLRNCLGKEIGTEVFIPWEMRGNSLSPAIEYNHCFRIACQYIWHKTWFRMISVYFHCLDDRIQDKNIVQSTDVLPARRISVLLKGVCSSLCFFDLKQVLQTPPTPASPISYHSKTSIMRTPNKADTLY